MNSAQQTTKAALEAARTESNAADRALADAEQIAIAQYGSLADAYQAKDQAYLAAQVRCQLADEAFSVALRADMNAQKTDRVGAMMSFDRNCQ